MARGVAPAEGARPAPPPRRVGGALALLLTTLFVAVAAEAGPGRTDLAAQAPAAPPAADANLRVFLDCQRCDFDHFRREVTFVDYVRDRADADLHVLVTSEGTGGGGESYSLFFIGLGDLAGAQDTLRFVSRESDTEDEVRTGLVETFKMGLMRHVAGTPAARLIDIRYDAPAAGLQRMPTDDPWNLWVFEMRVGGEIEGESRQRSASLDGSLSASRTTEDLKIDISSFGRFESDRFELTDETIVSTARDLNHEALVVWSLGPHWSAGARASAITSTEVNQDLAIRAAPAIEYSVYPYAESTRRQISVLYSVGLAAFDYEEITLFDQMAETLAEQRLELSAQIRQPWGDVSASLEGSSFLHDLSIHRIDLFANIEYRIFRGLAVDVRGNVARVKDQIYVRRAEVSNEEIFLERTRLGTDFEYGLELGLSFTFGSVFNTVVNPRFGSNRDRRFFN
jgi:hypothetical protein